MADFPSEQPRPPPRPEVCPKCKALTDAAAPFCPRCSSDLGYSHLEAGLRCVYCDAESSLSEEHVFGDWLNRKFPHGRTRHGHRLQRPAYLAFWGKAGPTYTALAGKARARRPYDLKVRNVCKSCNNGWMSRAQRAAKSAVSTLAFGQWPEMGDDVRRVLAHWSAIVAVSLEHYAHQNVSLPGQRRQLMDGSIPNGWHVFCGILPTASSAGRHHASSIMAPVRTFDDQFLSAGSIYFIIERVTFHVYYTLGEISYDLFQYANGWNDETSPLARLWPLSTPKPAVHNVTLADLELMQAIITGSAG